MFKTQTHKSISQFLTLLSICLLILTKSTLASNDNDNWSLGSIGGTFRVQPGTNYLEVKGVESTGPGGTAGLQVGDFIYKAFGVPFRELSANRSDGYKGSVQDLADAIEKAESGNGTLSLTVMRPGAGDVNLTISLPVAGAFGPAYPLGSSKFDTMYQWGCEEIHSQVTASSNGNFGYETGLMGLVLISHPNWNDTTGSKPYRPSVDKLKNWCVGFIQNRILTPVERVNADGTPNDGSANDSDPSDQSWVNEGLGNWTITTAAMYLAEYRRKTGDASLDVDVQTAADVLVNRIHTHSEYEGGPYGRMGHGGLDGHYGGGALNIMNAHTMSALAMLKGAGATVDDVKFQASWQLTSGATNTSSNIDNGAVGYVTGGGGAYDSSGRTAGVAFGMENYGGMSAADQAIVDTQKEYIWRQWERMQHTHAYTVGGVVFTQFLLPYMEDRQQRYLMENQRLFYHFSRNTAGTLSYFGGRYNNGGDQGAYLDSRLVAIINTCMAQAIASGNLPSFPAIDSTRLHAEFVTPALTWPSIDARYLKTTTGSVTFSNVNISDYLGSVLNTSDYSVTWSHVSGPATATFSNGSSITPTVTLPAQGRYRIQVEVTKGGYTLTEPIDIDYFPGTTPAGYTSGAITEEIYSEFTGILVSDLTSHASYPNSPSSTRTITSIEGTEDANDYGSRIRGYIIAPVTGDYTFYVAGDNNAEFLLSSDDTEGNKSKICYTTTWTDVHEWDQNPEQTSSVQSLVAGQAYFFEVLHKAQSGGDHVAVAWTFPGVAIPEVIGSDYIAQQGSGTTTIVGQPQNVSVAAGANATMSVSATGAGPFIYQWRKDGVAYWPASSSANLVLTNVGAGAAGDYECVITSPTGSVTSNTAELTVTGVGVLTTGGLWRDVFTDITGAEVSDLVSYNKYPYFPDSGAVITSSESPQNEGENYGSRWSGWIKPDVTGDYTFYLTGDNTAEVWLSTDDQPANIVKITEITTHTGYREWQHSAAGVSSAISLVNGNRYYIEVRHKESKIGDHCGVAWQKPGDSAPVNGDDAAIPSQYLEYITGGVYFTNTPVSLTRVAPASDSVRIRPNIGLELECSVSSFSANATVVWTKQSGPGGVTFTDVSSLATGATFSANGNYVLRCSFDNGGVPATYDFNVEVTSEASTTWTSVSIAEPATGNGIVNADRSITVQGSGDDIYSRADECQLFHQSLTGDFDVRARVVSKSLSSSFGTHAQIMARESSAVDARNIAVTHERVDRLAFQYRESTAGQTTWQQIPSINLPVWIRLVRSGGNPATGAAGQTFTGYYSTDSGATWIQRDTVTYSSAMPDTLLVGFAVSSAGTSLNTVVYDNVSGFAIVENVAAEANAGSDFTTPALTGQALSGSSVDDNLPATPGTVTNLWSKVSGPGTVTFTDDSALNTTVDFSLPGEYVLRLTSDDGSAKTYDEITVTAVADFSVNIASTDSSAAGDGSDAGEFTVTRSGATTSALTVNLAIAGSATNGTDYTTVANTLVIPVGQSSVTVTISPLFDAVQEGIESVEMSIAAGPYNSVATAAIVNIGNALGVNAPSLTGATFNVEENLPSSTTVGTVAVTDADVGETFIFTITAGNTGSAFAIDNGGVITTTALLDHESTASYTLTVEVEDSGSMTDTATITVVVDDVNEAPVASADSMSLNASDALTSLDVLANDSLNGDPADTFLGFANPAVSYDAGTSGSPQSPTVSGWTEIETEDGDVTTGNVTAVASVDDNGSGLDAWIVTDTSQSGGQWAQYSKAPTAAEIALGNSNGWVLETKMRFVDDFNDSGSTLIEYGNGSNRFRVFFDLNGNDDLTASLVGTGGGAVTLTSGGTGADAFLDIQILYSPNTQTASFVVNGVRHDGGSWSGENSGATGVKWGNESSAGRGSAAFNTMKWSYFDTSATLASGATVQANGNNIEFQPNGGYDSLAAGVQVVENVEYVLSNGSGFWTTGALAVTITGVNDDPQVTAATVDVADNVVIGTLVHTVSAVDPDPADSVTGLTITAGNVGGAFTINAAGEITTLTALDADVTSSYSLTVEATNQAAVTGTGVITINVIDTGLVAHWAMNDGSGAVVTDVENGFNGVLQGATWSTGVDDGGLSFDGSNDYVDLSAHISEVSSLAEGTIAGWIKTSATGAQTIFAASDATDGSSEVRFYLESGNLRYDFRDDSSAPANEGGSVNGSSVNDGVWHHVAVTVNSSETAIIYVDGVQVATGSEPFMSSLVGINSMSIGRNVDSSGPQWHFSGEMEDMKFFKKALTATEIVALGELAPVATDATFAAAETVSVGTAIGTVSVSEPNLNDTLSYTITAGNVGNAFAIDANGTITTLTALDFETLDHYSLSVSVTDDSASALNDSAIITVNVTDVYGDVDTDTDNLDDTWETLYFGNLTTTDGTLDSDADGQTDADEYAAATAPMDASDKLEIISVAKATSNATVNWSSKQGVSYRLEYSYDLDTWNTVVAGQTGATGQMGYADTDATRLASEKVFYRVVVE